MAENIELTNHRIKLDQIDLEIIKLMAKRMNITIQIGHLKSKNNIPIYQENRWNTVLKERMEFGEKMNLDQHFIKKYMEIVHEESIRIQKQNQ